MTARSWTMGCFLLLTSAMANPCLAQSAAQLACEKAAAAGYQYCLEHGLPCAPQEPCGNAPPHRNTLAQCLPSYSAAYARCQPSFSLTSVGGPAANVAWPPARELAAYWSDAQGHFWLFGGFGLDVPASVAGGVAGPINDLWRYTRNSTPSAPGTWQSMGGSNVLGTASTPSMPGGRAAPTFSTDAKGDVWLFGGVGYGPQSYGALNDLWEYIPGSGGAAGTWKPVWSSGPNVVNQAGNYGTQNTASATNAPGGRWNAVSWIDAQGNFWLFGGFAIGSLGGPAYFFNDLWEYSLSTGMWTWMNGATAVSRTGTVTTAGMPGGRAGASSWTDGRGNVWVFGGYGFDSTGALGALNDLWLYNTGSGQWSMVGGSATVAGATGNYGVKATPSASNAPPGRSGATAWSDSQGNFWLFGGTNANTWLVDSPPPVSQSLFNDLWEYKTGATGAWIWIGGPQGLGSTAPPGARLGAAAWPETFPSFFLFGGYGIDSPSQFPAYLDDLWYGSGVVY